MAFPSSPSHSANSISLSEGGDDDPSHPDKETKEYMAAREKVAFQDVDSLHNTLRKMQKVQTLSFRNRDSEESLVQVLGTVPKVRGGKADKARPALSAFTFTPSEEDSRMRYLSTVQSTTSTNAPEYSVTNTASSISPRDHSASTTVNAPASPTSTGATGEPAGHRPSDIPEDSAPLTLLAPHHSSSAEHPVNPPSEGDPHKALLAPSSPADGPDKAELTECAEHSKTAVPGPSTTFPPLDTAVDNGKKPAPQSKKCCVLM